MGQPLLCRIKLICASPRGGPVAGAPTERARAGNDVEPEQFRLLMTSKSADLQDTGCVR
jgi:hypothetical protein